MADDKDRSANPEVLYGDEFAELVLTGRTDGIAHRLGLEALPPAQPSGSQNYATLLFAARLMAGWLRLATEAAWARAFAAACLEVPTKALRAAGWMGTEAGSLIYLALHFLPWLAVALHAKGDELRQKARMWVRYTLAMLEVCATPEGRCALVGQRSAKPGSDAPGWHDVLLGVARGLEPTDCLGWPKNKQGDPMPLAKLPWIWRLLVHWRAEVAAIGATIPRGVEAFEVLANSPLRLFTEYRWAHRPDGTFVAVWVDGRELRADVNGNTPPALARVRVEGGLLVMLPRGGGEKRIRGNKKDGGDQATCTLDGRTLRYTARRSRPSPDAITLPPGPLVLRSSRNGFRPEVLP